MAKRKTHEQQIANQCIQEAQTVLGKGWGHVSMEIRRGLVMTRVVAVIRGQCETIPAETKLRYLDALVAATDEILEGK